MIEDDVAVISATSQYQDGKSAGGAFLFEFKSNKWQLIQELAPDRINDRAAFGFGMALNGELLVIGAKGTQSGRGAVYVYRRNDESKRWLHETTLIRNNNIRSEHFGCRVGVLEDTIAASVGAPAANGGGVSIYQRAGGEWQPTDFTVGRNAKLGDRWGETMLLEDDLLIVANSKRRVVNLLRRNASKSRASYREEVLFSPPEEVSASAFGNWVDLEGDLLGISDANYWSGRLYFFDLADVRDGLSSPIEQMSFVQPCRNNAVNLMLLAEVRWKSGSKEAARELAARAERWIEKRGWNDRDLRRIRDNVRRLIN